MKQSRYLTDLLVILSLVLAVSASAVAQGVPQGPPPPFSSNGEPGPGGPPPGDRFDFVGFEMSLGGRLVKGAPYSAQTTMQITQTLGDGNHINRTVTGQVFRDSQGRTRRENSLPAIGPWVAEGKTPQMIVIHDPVAGVHYVLNANDKTALKMTPPADAGGGNFGANHPRHDKGDGQTSPDGQTSTGPHGRGNHQVVKEPLGKQIIEGVEAEGTRETITIPAGEIGNERPIQIVSERWYSADLHMVILAKRSDPRMGESIYRVTNIVRTEPPATLFVVPADYTVKEGHGGPSGRRMRMPFGRQ